MSDTIVRNVLMELVQGQDYLAVDDRAITVPGVGVCWPSTISAVRMLIYEPLADCAGAVNASAPAAVVDVAGVYAAATVAPAALAAANVSFDLPRTETLKLASGVRRYQMEIRALLQSGSTVTLCRGFVTVLDSRL